MGTPDDRAAFRLCRSDLVAPGLTLIAFLPFAAPALGLFYSANDLMNLVYYLARPGETLVSNLVVFTSFHRPLGGLVLLPLYWLFGMNAAPLYAVMSLLLIANMVFFSLLIVRMTGDRTLAALAPLPLLFHPIVNQIVYDAGALYEVLALAGLLAALHCWLSFRSTGRTRWYLGALGFFLLALNSKETAVVLPALILAWEVVFRNPGRSRAAWTRILITTAPLALVSALFTMAKMWGAEAYWRGNPAYLYDFNPVVLYDRLAVYLSRAVGWVRFGDPELAQTLIGLAILAVVFRSGAMALGLVWFLATLAPVLPLPRVWSLFLYIPLAGVSLCAVALLLASQRWLRKVGRDHFRISVSGFGRTLFFAALLVVVYGTSAAAFDDFLIGSAVERRRAWSDLSLQLQEKRGELPAEPIIALQAPKLQDPGLFYSTHHLVRLTLGDLERPVFRLPEQQGEFAIRSDPADRVILRWSDHVLVIEPAG